MKKKSAWIAFKTLGLIISIVLIISYIGVLLRDFEKDVRREETRREVLCHLWQIYQLRPQKLWKKG